MKIKQLFKNLGEESKISKEQNPLEVLRIRDTKLMEKDKEENKDHGMQNT